MRALQLRAAGTASAYICSSAAQEAAVSPAASWPDDPPLPPAVPPLPIAPPLPPAFPPLPPPSAPPSVINELPEQATISRQTPSQADERMSGQAANARPGRNHAPLWAQPAGATSVR